MLGGRLQMFDQKLVQVCTDSTYLVIQGFALIHHGRVAEQSGQESRDATYIQTK